MLYCRTGDDANHSYINPAAYVLTLNRFYYSGLADCFNRLCFYLPGFGKTPQAAAAAYGCSQISPAQLQAYAGELSCGFLDRKSTRLNSSHVAISYAVFCLKKKKILNE